jgi:prophage regulatory protein
MEYQDVSSRVLRLKAVQGRTGLSRSSIYLKMSNNTFPTSIKLGLRGVGWLEDEVNAWIKDRVQQSRAIAPECKNGGGHETA